MSQDSTPLVSLHSIHVSLLTAEQTKLRRLAASLIIQGMVNSLNESIKVEGFFDEFKFAKLAFNDIEALLHEKSKKQLVLLLTVEKQLTGVIVFGQSDEERSHQYSHQIQYLTVVDEKASTDEIIMYKQHLLKAAMVNLMDKSQKNPYKEKLALIFECPAITDTWDEFFYASGAKTISPPTPYQPFTNLNFSFNTAIYIWPSIQKAILHLSMCTSNSKAIQGIKRTLGFSLTTGGADFNPAQH